MSSSRRRSRQHIDAWPVVDTQAAVEQWVPDWGVACRVCGGLPCAAGLRDGQVVFESHLCGICAFNDDDCVDPDKW
jgi:hypothetical protein